MTKTRLSFLAAISLIACVSSARAELIYAVNGNNELLTFDSSAPAAILSRTPITNTGGEDILNIDFRPGTGQLFGLGAANNLYTISLGGAASFVGATGIVGGFDYAFDFNPVPDRIRIATDTGSNFRVNPANGAVNMPVDGNLFYVVGDSNNGTAPQVAGAAYTNNFGPSPRTPPPGTALYYIDFNLNILALSPNPNSGDLMTIGGLGLDVTGLLGFDISGVTGLAFASLSTDGVLSGFYTIDLASGTASSLGAIGAGETILDISAAPVPEPSTYALLGLAALGLIFLRNRKIKTA